MPLAANATVFNDLDKLDSYLTRLTLDKMREKGVGYGQAYKLIASENPSLMALRGQLTRNGEQQPASTAIKHVLPSWSPLEDPRELEAYLGRLASTRARADNISYGHAVKLTADKNPELLALRQGLLRRERGAYILSERTTEALSRVDAELREHWDRVWNANRFVCSDEMVGIFLSESPQVRRLCRRKGDLLRGIYRGY